MSRNAERMILDIERVSKTLNALPKATIITLTRRAGKEESVAPSGERVSVALGSHSDPTANAVARRLDSTHPETDLVYAAVKAMAEDLRQMADLAMRVEQRVRFVLEVKERAKEAQIAHCEACRREVANTPNDRLRSGYCPRDYMAWLRSGKPYRATFEASTREAISVAALAREFQHS